MLVQDRFKTTVSEKVKNIIALISKNDCKTEFILYSPCQHKINPHVKAPGCFVCKDNQVVQNEQ